MSCLRPGRFAAQLWVCSVFFAYSASAVADPPALLEGDASGTACAAPYAGRCQDAFPHFVSTPDQPWTQPLPPIDDGAADPYPVQAASHWNAALEMESCEPSRCLDFLSLDDLHQEIRRRDAAASSGSNYGRGMTLVLDDEGKKYIRFLTWAQVWTTSTDNNPGTVDDYGDLKDDSLDIGLRRVRFLTYSQLTEKYLILVHVGINNQTFTNGGGSGSGGVGPYGAGKKPQIFFHDVWNEYAVIPPSECSDFSLAMGAGLLYWNGISRKSSSSTFSYMTVDSPIFCWPNIEFSDEFARQLGWYAKGKFHKLDYRFSVTQPFDADDRKGDVDRPVERPPLNSERAVNIPAHSLAFAGYCDWEFWDQESNLLPYKTSSWLGEKSVFNIGAGFYYHPDSSGILDAAGQLEKQDQLAVGIDCYFDKPVGNCGAALTLYGVYYIFDYGDNYFRNIGIMNTGPFPKGYVAPGGIETSISGGGNAQPFMGTGEIFYLEGGYVLPSWVLGESHGRLQPFGAFTHKNLAWLDDPAFNWDMGVNYLIDGHRAKLTFQYSLRPLFFERTEGGVARRVSDGSAGEFIIQAQCAL